MKNNKNAREGINRNKLKTQSSKLKATTQNAKLFILSILNAVKDLMPNK